MKKFLSWLKGLFIKSDIKSEATTMTDTTASDATTTTAATDTATAATTTDTSTTETVAATAEPVLSEVDLFAAKLKELVETAGSQAHAYFDDLVELAKKLI